MCLTRRTAVIIISADDCARPVLAYGEQGGALNDAMPANLKAWLEGYNYSIGKAVEDGYTAPTSVHAEWEALAKGEDIDAYEIVPPLIKTIWNQWDGMEYYNYYTPIGTYEKDGKTYTLHTPTGCVATCMAQVMKYWEWPKQGTGSHSYLPGKHPEYGEQYADFGATTYDWANMPDSLTYQSRLKEAQSIALLQYHCGVAMNMDYDPEGSGAPTVIRGKYAGYSPAVHALCTYFGYSNAIQGYTRSEFFNPDDWTQMLKDELDAGRPMMYAGGGDNNEPGHSFVCCGYDSADRFYFNLGWGGAYDGYYALDAIRPGGGDIGGNNDRDYSYRQDVIIGIRPAETATERAYDYALRMSYDTENYAKYSPSLDKDSLLWQEDELRVDLWVDNLDSLQYKGAVAVEVIDAWGRVTAMSSTQEVTIGAYSSTKVMNLRIAPSMGLVPGRYHLRPVYRTSEGGWSPIDYRYYWSEMQFVVYFNSTIFAYSTPHVYPEPLVQGRTGSVVVEIANATGSDLSDAFIARLYTPEGEWVQDIDTVDISISPMPDHYYYSFVFDGLITAAPGEYVMIIEYVDVFTTYPLGCDWYNAALRVPVIAEEDVPEEMRHFRLEAANLRGVDMQTHEWNIWEGDTVGVYTYLRNAGLGDFNGWVGLVLYDFNWNWLKDVTYGAYCGALSTLSGALSLDTTLTAGYYFVQVWYYEAPDWYVMPCADNLYNPFVIVVQARGEEALEEVGLETTGEPIQTKAYSILGQPLSPNVAKGVYILHQTDANGNISTKRILKP